MLRASFKYGFILGVLALSCGPVQAATDHTREQEAGRAAPAPVEIVEADSSPARVQLSATVTGLRSRDGDLLGYVFADERGFPRDLSRATKRVQLSASSDRVSFQVAPGRYAIVLVHDENKNGSLDKNFIGMPREGIGLSNFEFEGRPRRPPRWSEAAVQVDGRKTVEIKMNYF